MSTSGPGRGPPAGIPTLTEVVAWPGQGPVAPAVSTASNPAVTPGPVAAVPAAPDPMTTPAPALAMAPVAAPIEPVAVAAPAASTASAPPAAPASKPAVHISEAQLVQRVLSDLQRQIDLMLEVRLREVLAPVLARATDALIRDARKELTVALRDAVARAVAQELARRENR